MKQVVVGVGKPVMPAAVIYSEKRKGTDQQSEQVEVVVNDENSLTVDARSSDSRSFTSGTIERTNQLPENKSIIFKSFPLLCNAWIKSGHNQMNQ